MNITELDEFQGLTAEMVREWLLANQWEPCGSSAAHLYYQCGSGEISEALLHEDLGWVVDLLAQSYERSVQSILREINPRMRKGVPSKEARAAAKSYWLASWGEGSRRAANLWDSDLMEHFADSPELVNWSFWPCDEHGNKTRWPTDAEGNML